MKLNQQALNLDTLQQQGAKAAQRLQLAQASLSSLARQDKESGELYRLLGQQGQALQSRCQTLQQPSLHQQAIEPLRMDLMTMELTSLVNLSQLHLQLVAWLSGDDLSGGLVQKPGQSGPAKASQPKPQPKAPSPGDSAAPAAPALDFN